MTAGKIVGGVAVVAGAAYLAAQAGDGGRTELTPLISDDGDGGEKFGYVDEYWMETASEDELRETEAEMEAELERMDYGSEEYNKLYLKQVDVVNAIAYRFPLNLPHREHGWYLPNDD